MKHYRDCGTERAGDRRVKGGKSFSTATLIAVLVIAGFLLLVAYADVHLVGQETRAAAVYSTRREEVQVYDEAAESVRAKFQHGGIDDVATAPFSINQVSNLGDGRYRVEVPYRGPDFEGKPKTQMATCLVHCDRGLCYADGSDLK